MDAERDINKMVHPSVLKNLKNFNEYLRKQGTAVTDNPVGIEKILNEFSDTKRYQINFHWDSMGFMLFQGCSLSNDSSSYFKGNTIEIDFGSFYSLIKPTMLETFYIQEQPDFSFMRLGYQGLAPTGLNEDHEMLKKEFGYEAYKKNSRGIISLEEHEQRFYDYDNGYRENLPEEAITIHRELRGGNFMIVSKGSVLNASKYDVEMRDIAKNGINSKYFPKIELIH